MGVQEIDFEPVVKADPNASSDEGGPMVIAKALTHRLTLEQALGFKETDEGALDAYGAIPWRYDLAKLNIWLEKSNALRQNVDAYVTNIDGHGLAYEPEIDLEADDTDDRVRAIIQMEQQELNNRVDVPDPTPEEVEKRKRQLADEQRKELLEIHAFMEYAVEGMSFVDLRRITRQDYEVTGNAYWEIRRDQRKRISQFGYLPSYTMYLLPLDPMYTTCVEMRRTATKKLTAVTVRRQFRRLMQRVGERCVFFKEFGDPRVMSARTGKYYASEEEMLQAEPGDKDRGIPPAPPATEVKHFKIHSPHTPYGVPRWIGNITSVAGSRAAEEVNFSYFDNKSVPPLALLVSGGRLSQSSVKAIEKHIDNKIKGRDNYHSILLIEAQGERGNAFENSGQPKIELKPLTEAQNSDALFQSYDERNVDKVGMAFRLPRMLRGDTRDFNRSTAQAALDFAERQVFAPERSTFDYWFNRFVLPEIGIKHWKIKSSGPTQRDPESLAKMIHDLQDVFGINTLMELAQPVFGRNFSRIDADWADKPLKLVLAELAQQAAKAKQGLEPNPGGDSPEADDADPDNQDGTSSGMEAMRSRTETADNKANEQPRNPDGTFGNVRAKAKRPAKRRQRRVHNDADN